MYNFNPVVDFGIEDLCKEDQIAFLISKLEIGIEKNVLLDIRKCFIDYPTTGKLLDSILNELAEIEGKKTVTIYYDFHLPDYDLLACLFDETTFFGSTNFKEIDQDKIIQLINDKATANEIEINIVLYKISNQETKVLKYGV